MKSREQINYAQCRLEAEFRKKQTKLRLSFTKHTTPPLLTDVIAKIKSGEFKLAKGFAKDRPLFRTDTVSLLFGIRVEEINFDHKGYEAANSALEAARQKAMDAIMLGEASEALKTIEAFANS